MPERWDQGGVEPSVAELLIDPICVLLRERDGVSEADVWRAVESAGQALFEAPEAA